MNTLIWITTTIVVVTASTSSYNPVVEDIDVDPELANLLGTIFGEVVPTVSTTAAPGVTADCHPDAELPPIPDLEPTFLEGVMLTGAIHPVTGETIEGSQLKGFYASAEACSKACKKFFGCFAADYNIQTGACIVHSAGVCSVELTDNVDYIHFRKVPCEDVILEALDAENIYEPTVHVAANYRVPATLKVPASNVSECIWKCATAGAGFQATGVEDGQICFGVDYNPHTMKCFLQFYFEWVDDPDVDDVTLICDGVDDFLEVEGKHANGFIHYTFCP